MTHVIPKRSILEWPQHMIRLIFTSSNHSVASCALFNCHLSKSAGAAVEVLPQGTEFASASLHVHLSLA